jgi:adenosylcobinamide amidohydrolase
MYLQTLYNGVELHREDKIIYGRFLEPHLVLSTCRSSGGMQRDMKYVLNHQSCEPAGHHRRLVTTGPDDYRRRICEKIDLPAEKCVTMGTAANMHHAAFVNLRFRDLEVVAVITGGVETNAGRAGDPASVMEGEKGYEKLDREINNNDDIPGPGTINIMLFISHALTEAALTRTIITATEAKSAALQELAVNSRYSDGLATGTGTDQIIVAAPDRDGFRLSWAGKHSKLGELIGRTVQAGVKETLAKQNSLTPMGQCSVKIHLERFGCDSRTIQAGISRSLPEEDHQILADNFTGIMRDPVTVAAVAAMVHIRDKFTWSILPYSCYREIMGNAAAAVACAMSGCYGAMARYRNELGNLLTSRDNTTFLDLCFRAMALGFHDKWETL